MQPSPNALRLRGDLSSTERFLQLIQNPFKSAVCVLSAGPIVLM